MKMNIDMLWTDKKRYLGMPISFTRYSLSKDRIFQQKGLLSVNFEEIVLYRVTDISLKMTLGQRIFGVGTVIIHSSDKSSPHFEMKNIRSPLAVKEVIHEQVEKMKLARRVRVNELIGDDIDDCDDCGDDINDDID